MTRLLWVLLIISHYGWALPFNTMDTRSLSMGGTGTGSAKATAAHLFNPALLSVSSKKPSIGIVLPNITTQAIFKMAHYDALNNLNEKRYGEKISTAIDAMNAMDSTNFEDNRRIFIQNTSELLRQLQGLKKRSLSMSINPARISISRTSPTFGFSLYLNSMAFFEVSPSISDCDTQLLKAYLTVIREVDSEAPQFDQEKNMQLSCKERIEAIRIVDIGNTKEPILNMFKQYQPPPTPSETERNEGNNITLSEEQLSQQTLTSKIHMTGVAIAELGFSIAHQINLGSAQMALGVTPKIMRIQTVHAYPSVKSITLNNEKISTLMKSKTQRTAFNGDIGLALNLFGNDDVIAGLSIKNLLKIPLKNDLYQPIEGEKVAYNLNINTQVRAGIQFRQAPWAIALDIDLSENTPVYSSDKTQYFSLGTEYRFANDLIVARAGVKNNLQNHADISLSTGFSVQLSPLYLDLGVFYGFKSMGAGIQFGLDL